jgi:hypothetical protein
MINMAPSSASFSLVFRRSKYFGSPQISGGNEQEIGYV